MAKKKEAAEKVDGLSAVDIKKIRVAIRQVWSWSHPKRLALQRSVAEDGFHRCEMCKEKVPKVFVDHKIAVGNVDAGFIARLFCPSSELQVLCKSCHNEKTKEERKALKLKR